MPLILSTDAGPVRTLSLNRPDVRNALSADLREALRVALDEAEASHQVRAIVLTGEGSAFCAGLDLRELSTVADAPAERSRDDARRLGQLLHRIYTFPKPVVAAVSGPAIAGGAGLASVCDVVIAAERATFGYTEARIGFVAALVAVFLVRQVGDRKARELLLGARIHDAREALSLGLVNEVVADGEARKRAEEVAAELARHAPSSLELTKSLLATLPGLGLEDGLRYAADVNALARSTSDLKEGVAAFLEKREPAWRAAALDPDGTDT